MPSISSSSLQQRLENAHIYTSTSASIISTREHQAIPETSLSTGNTPSSPQQLKLQQEVNSTGKGMLLQILPPHIPLFMVEFKSGRTDFYYVSDPMLHLRVGDLVIVEADRGKDLGKVATDILTVDQVVLLQKQQNNSNCNRLVIDEEDTTKKISNNDSHVKRIYRQASPDEVGLLLIKEQDEQRALTVCLQKIKNRKLLMEVVDAEFQWYVIYKDTTHYTLNQP